MNQNLSIITALQSEVRPRTILRDISTFWGLHSTVAGPGLRSVSEFLLRRYQETGVTAEIHSYPADDETLFLDGQKNPLAWFPHAAELELAVPGELAGRICSYAEEPLCLLSNSSGTPPGGVTAEVVVIHNATSPEAYAGMDVTGKIVFTDVWPLLADEQARKHGAVGIITDSVTPPWLYDHPPVRKAADVPDLVMWGVLNGHRSNVPLWGFSLSPRQGARLREMMLNSSPDCPVVLRATIDATLCPGVSDLTTAFLPGTDLAEKEIWILAHASEPGALDNASGCCASIEAARMIKTLTASGALPPLRRSIRFLHAVETEGYMPYLTGMVSEFGATSGFEKIVAALAFDSIGSDFRKTGGTLRIHRSPEYNLSFAEDLLEELLVTVAGMQNEHFSDESYELFPWQVDPCFPGNDNMIADGFFDIPTPMLVCWPDKFYHSNLDTPDKLSAGSLARCTVLGAAYAYTLATAGIDEARQMAGLTLKAWKKRVLDGANPLSGEDALKTILRLDSSLKPELDEMIGELKTFAQVEHCSSVRWRTTDTPASPLDGQVNDEGKLLKPLRWKPPSLGLFSPAGQIRFEELKQQAPNIEQVWWLINGRRTVRDVCARTPIACDMVIAYIDLLVSESFVN